jgi:hypothetical protein
VREGVQVRVPAMHVCGVCRNEQSSQPSVCGACRSAVYCGTACQEKDWTHGSHHRECAKLGRARRALPSAYHHLVVAAHRAQCAARSVPPRQTDPIDTAWQHIPPELLLYITRTIDSTDDLRALISVLSRPPAVAPPPTLPVQQFVDARVGPEGPVALMEALLRLRAAPLYVPRPDVPSGTPASDGEWGARRRALFEPTNTVSWAAAGRAYWPLANVEARLAATFMPPRGLVLRAGWLEDGVDSVKNALNRPPAVLEQAAIPVIVAATKEYAAAYAAGAPGIVEPIVASSAQDKTWTDRSWVLTDEAAATVDAAVIALNPSYAWPVADFWEMTIGVAAVNVGGNIVVDANDRAFDRVAAVSGEVFLNGCDANTLPALRTATAVRVGLRNTPHYVAQNFLPSLVHVEQHVMIEPLTSHVSLQAAFPALRTVGGAVDIRDTINLTSIANAFAALENAGEVTLHRNDALVSLDGAFAKLKSVDISIAIRLNAHLTHITNAFAALESVGDNITIAHNVQLASIDGAFATLTRVGQNMKISGNPQLASPNGAFAALKRVGRDVAIAGNAQIVSLDGMFGALVRVGRDVIISTNERLVRIGGAFAALERVGRDLDFISNAQLVSLDREFPSLARVGRHIYIRDNKRLASIARAFASLKSTGGSPAIIDNPQLANGDDTFGGAFAGMESEKSEESEDDSL